jgi:hypothetical protein
MQTTCSSASRSPRTTESLSTWAASSQMTAREPESPSTHWHSRAELVGYTGTTTPPAAEMPYEESVHSTRVSDSTPTRSPGVMPSATRPRAICSIASRVSPYVISCHMPSSL